MASKAGKGKSKSSKARSMTKSQLCTELAGKTGLKKAQVIEVMDAMAALVSTELKGGRPIAIPGLVKISRQHKAATPAKTMMSPFTKEMITVKAKPARHVVKVRALKALKDSV